MNWIHLVKLYCLLCSAYSLEYNLYGDAGQAYSVEVLLGRPKQKLRLIVDTGSTTLAVASYSRVANDEYFDTSKSKSLSNSDRQIQAKYSQGNWLGSYVSDFVEIPSLKNVPPLRTDFAAITSSQKFFMNGSGWQGLLGLAYPPVGAWGDHVIVGSWLDSVECFLEYSVSFKLELCGVQNRSNATHYGRFSMIFDDHADNATLFRTPVLHRRWYEVGVLAVNIKHFNQTNDSDISGPKSTIDENYEDMCRKLNAQKSIIDSGTTNIRLPDEIFRKVADLLRQESQSPDMLILDEFWYHGEAACWPEPQDWLALPWITIDLVSDDADDQYFTLEIPPQNYMRVVTAHNNTSEDGAVSQFCYKLGLEAGGTDTVLGYTAMEGLEVLFNRSGNWIGWQPSECGPNARVSGPYTAQRSFFDTCNLSRTESETAVSIQAAQWALCGISIIAVIVLLYLLAPCIKMMILKRFPPGDVSTEMLVDQELSGCLWAEIAYHQVIRLLVCHLSHKKDMDVIDHSKVTKYVVLRRDNVQQK